MDEKLKKSELEDELKEVFEAPLELIIKSKENSQSMQEKSLTIKKEEFPIIAAPEGLPSEVVNKDFDYARNNLYEVIEQGKDALAILSNILRSGTCNATTFETAGMLIKNISESTKELMELHKSMKQIQKEEKAPNVTNNNLILTTDEVIKRIKDGKK
jgi:hypothetical protein